jgi:antitoxin (DNA-binding transcriptional repressor) of toxin-antitoxin stability system
MKKASIAEARNNLGKVIDGLAGGTSVLIVDRGRSVAPLEPVTSGVAPDDGRLSRLVCASIVHAGSVRSDGGKPARSVLASPPPRTKRAASVLTALLDERRKGR